MITTEKFEGLKNYNKGDLIAKVMNDPKLRHVGNISLFIATTSSQNFITIVSVKFNGESTITKHKRLDENEFTQYMLTKLSNDISVTLFYDEHESGCNWMSHVLKDIINPRDHVINERKQVAKIVELANICSLFDIEFNGKDIKARKVDGTYRQKKVETYLGNLYIKNKGRWKKVKFNQLDNYVFDWNRRYNLLDSNPEVLKLLTPSTLKPCTDIIEKVLECGYVTDAKVNEKYDFICDVSLSNDTKCQMIFSDLGDRTVLVMNHKLDKPKEYKLVMFDNMSLGEYLEAYIELIFITLPVAESESEDNKSSENEQAYVKQDTAATIVTASNIAEIATTNPVKENKVEGPVVENTEQKTK